jgi:cyanate permease
MIATLSQLIDRISMTVGAATLLAALPVAAYATVAPAFLG